MIKKELMNLLHTVEKPIRYLGGEYNMPAIVKNKNTITNCFCFPDVYEVGMSHTGMKILYEILNDIDDCVCERCFAPWTDFGKLLKEQNIELFSLETQTPLKEFNFVHFTFQYELAYTNFLYMLDLSNIPFYSVERGEDLPIIVGGGPCSTNFEPIADFLDIIIVGDGEEVNVALMDLAKKYKCKAEILKHAEEIEGVYVPKFHKMRKKDKFFIPEGSVKRAIVKDLNKVHFIEKPLVPNMEIIHDRGAVEIFRGCTRGCRFCQAGFYYRPIRERNVEIISKISCDIINNTGFNELSLFSLSTSDYSNLQQLIDELKGKLGNGKVKLVLPSLRLDSFKGAYALESKTASLTFAPEAGTQRLRDVINKNITEEDIFNSLGDAFKNGYNNIKLYFMLGLPTETNEDLDGICDLVSKIKKLYRECGRGKYVQITVSTSIFIPKPWTPFQWERHISIDECLQKITYLKRKLQDLRVRYIYHEIESAEIESLLARGDRSVGKVVELAYRNGCVYDGWNEFFNYEKWMDACKDAGVNILDFIGEIDEYAVLPWDYIDLGISKDYLLKERWRSRNGETTHDCRLGCNACGLQSRCLCKFVKNN